VLQSCRQYKPGDFLAVTPQNWDGISDEDDDNDNWADPGAPSGWRSCSRDGNDSDNDESEENTPRGEKGTGNGKGRKDGKGNGKATEDGKEKGKGKWKGNSKGKCIIKHTPAGDDISRAVAWLFQKEMSESDWDTEG